MRFNKADLERVGVRESDFEFMQEPRAYVWRVLDRELDKVNAMVDGDVESFSSAVARELWTAKSEIENAIGLVVAKLRPELAPAKKAAKKAAASPDAPKRKRGRPAGARTRTPAEKDAAARTIPIPGTEDLPAPPTTSNGAHAPLTEEGPIA